MVPHMAIGMGAHLDRLLSPDGATPTFPEREAFAPVAAFGDDRESSYENVPKGSTAIFRITGTMLKYGTWCDYGTAEIANFIREAVQHKNIGSIVLQIDSGGGSVSAIAPLLQVIREARTAGKPVISLVDLCASAAVYVSAETDLIIAENNVSAEIGSIGVMMSFWDVVPHYEKEGYKFHKVYSSLSEHKNEAFELALEGKYEMIKAEMLDPLAREFQNHVKTRRGDKLDTAVEGILSGKTFYANDALKYGLIDEVGNISLAIERANQLAESINFLHSK